MIYLFYVTWSNTEGNHSGMKYLCNKLEELYPEKFVAIEYSKPLSNFKSLKSSKKIIRYINRVYKIVYLKYDELVGSKIRTKKILKKMTFKSDDTYILMEYMITNVNQYEIARALKKRNPLGTIFGLSHLVPSEITRMYDDVLFDKWTSEVDYILTLGSSLTNYFQQRGIDEKKTITTFHYVDQYYIADQIHDADFKVLIQGNMKRNYPLLHEVILSNPDVNFVICQGLKDLREQFGKYGNVKLMPFMRESELRELMKVCPVSLNIMEDTIGSNVIVTSIGMGQAMICSDVGSIRNYCDDNNCIFCKNIGEFSAALQELKKDPKKLRKMREASLKKSKSLSLENFGKELISLVNQNRNINI